MYPANITRAEAAARSEQIAAHSYDISVDLSGRPRLGVEYDPSHCFVSTTTIRFTSRGGESWLNLIAEQLISATLDGRTLAETSLQDHRLGFATEPGEHEITVTALLRYSAPARGCTASSIRWTTVSTATLNSRPLTPAGSTPVSSSPT